MNENQTGNLKKPEKHRPVLVKEVLSVFPDPPLSLLDCTFGRGGHSQAFLRAFPEIKILALDRDLEAIEYGKKQLPPLFKNRLKLQNINFHDFPIKTDCYSFFDGILMDLGVSSPQLENPKRGFSFYRKGPLDMRMDEKKQTLKAKDILNDSSKEELIHLFKEYGEIPNPFPVINHLITERKKKEIESVEEFVKIILRHNFWNGRNLHPATAYFLALRIKVNNELEGLNFCLEPYLNLLKHGGKFMIISFHSLEDRIIKQSFKNFVKTKKGSLWNKKTIKPSLEEIKSNPRSRSAKLRVFIKNSTNSS